MNKQLTISNDLDSVSDAKSQAIYRFLNQGKDHEACVNQYSPGGRNTRYFRLSVRQVKKVKTFSYPRGECSVAKLAQDRAKELQDMIERDAKLSELIAVIQDYTGGGK